MSRIDQFHKTVSRQKKAGFPEGMKSAQKRALVQAMERRKASKELAQSSCLYYRPFSPSRHPKSGDDDVVGIGVYTPVAVKVHILGFSDLQVRNYHAAVKSVNGAFTVYNESFKR